MKNWIILVLASVALVMTAAPAVASVTLEDHTTFWNGWASPQPSDNSNDQIGTPIFFNDTALVLDPGGNRYLKSVTVNYTANDSFDNQILYGDLFLGKNPGAWDYVVQSKVTGGGDYLGNPNVGLGASTALNLFNFATPIALGSYSTDSNSVYKLTGLHTLDAKTASGDFWNEIGYSFDLRDRHPWALQSFDSREQVGEDEIVAFTGWYTGESQSTTWDFSALNGGLGLDMGVGNHVTIGFTVNCANDVLYATDPSVTADVPEPASIIVWSLIGMGSWMGVSVWRRRNRPAGRQLWSNENRQAILSIIERDRR